MVPYSICKVLRYVWTTTAFQQWPQFCGLGGGRCNQVWPEKVVKKCWIAQKKGSPRYPSGLIPEQIDRQFKMKYLEKIFNIRHIYRDTVKLFYLGINLKTSLRVRRKKNLNWRLLNNP